MTNSLNNLPYQPVLNQQPIQIMRLNSFHEESSLVPHRHSFYMVYWANSDHGLHYINFQEYEMLSGRVFFLHENQVHQVKNYPSEGWLVFFDKMLFRHFLNIHPHQEQTAIFDYFNRVPWVDSNAAEVERFNSIATLLLEEVQGANQLKINFIIYLCFFCSLVKSLKILSIKTPTHQMPQH